MTEITQGGPMGKNTPSSEQVARDFRRYPVVNVEDGEILLYDIEVTDAWIQSDLSVTLEEVA